MAREFANVTATPTADGILYSAVPPVGGLGTASIVMRAALDSDSPHNAVVFGCANASTYEMFGFSRAGSTTDLFFVCRNNNAQSIPSMTVSYDGTMRSVIGTFDGSLSGLSKIKLYLDGASQTVRDIYSTGIPNTTIGSGATYCNIGGKSGLNGFNGRLAEVAIYNRVITPEEAALHAAGYSCRNFPRGLIFWAPMIRDAQDIAGGLTATITGTTVADHPRMYA